ncbi:MAG: lipid-A-disaccharide synthase [Candidatus Aerophobetes bacterium]|nr:lipid-A-disaccharide synthase [Candidatus Aerophobetes bacterium]
MPELKILISATEVSGDIHAANLVKAIKRINPYVKFVGIGGERMQRAGVDVRSFTVHLGTIGLLEGVKYYPSFLKIRSMMKKILSKERPSLLILIDSRDFNLSIARISKKFGIPTVYYVAPPIWAWPDRKGKRVARELERVIAIFPFEAEIYRECGARVSFVGHPFLDIARPTMSKEESFRKFNLNSRGFIIGLLPGSREQEINSLLPLMLTTAGKVSRRLKNIQFLLPLPSSVFKDKIMRMVNKSEVPVKIVTDGVYDMMNVSHLLIISSGTATLEASCLGTPMIIVYKTFLSTWLIGKILVKLPYIGLPNILANKMIVPELLQFQAKPDRLSNLVLELVNHPQKLGKMRMELKKVVKKLGRPGVIDRAAKVVLEVVS